MKFVQIKVIKNIHFSYQFSTKVDQNISNFELKIKAIH